MKNLWFLIWRQCRKEDDECRESLEYFGPSYKVEREGQKDGNLSKKGQEQVRFIVFNNL